MCKGVFNEGSDRHGESKLFRVQSRTFVKTLSYSFVDTVTVCQLRIRNLRSSQDNKGEFSAGSLTGISPLVFDILHIRKGQQGIQFIDER
jgi:hypothetical protein